MSDTPRTDAARVEAGCMGGITMESQRERHYIEFARQLERELIAARDAALDEAAKECDRRALTWGQDPPDGQEREWGWMQDEATLCAAQIRRLKIL